MFDKYYRVKVDTFLWKAGAIIKFNKVLGNGKGGYLPIHDIWNVADNTSEYITAHIVEHTNNENIFERVYEDTVKGSVFRTKDQLKEFYEKTFKE